MKSYYMVFEDSEENKMQYMEIFNLYQQEIERFVQQVPAYPYRAYTTDYPTSKWVDSQHYSRPEQTKLTIGSSI